MNNKKEPLKKICEEKKQQKIINQMNDFYLSDGGAAVVGNGDGLHSA